MSKIKHILAIELIFLVTFFSWGKTLNQTFLGEGYFYFERWRSFISPTIGWRALLSYDNFGRIMFDIAPSIFRDNFFAYQLFQLLICFILYISVYIVIFKITHRFLISLFSSLFFASSFTGTFEMIADGNYDRFVQRIPNFIPAVFAFYFFFRFFKTYNKRYLVYALSLFALALFLAHFTSIMIPLFIAFPLVNFIFERNKKQKILTYLSVILLVIFVSAIMILPDPYQPHKSIIQFVLNTKNLLESIFLQLPIISLPHGSIPFLAKNFTKGLSNPYLPLVRFLSFSLTIIYIWVGKKIYKSDKQLFILYISLFLASFGGLFLYFYSDDKINPYKDINYGRQYFLFILYFSVINSISFFAVFFTKTKLKLIPFILLGLFIWNNSQTIWKEIDKLEYKHAADRRYIAYIKSFSNQFDNETVIFSRSPIHWPNAMILRVFAPEGATQVTNMDEFNKLKQINRDKVFVFDYDYELDPIKEPDPSKGKLIDLTQKFRNKKIDLSSW